MTDRTETTSEDAGRAAFWLGLVLMAWIVWMFVAGDVCTAEAILHSWKVWAFMPASWLCVYLVGKAPV